MMRYYVSDGPYGQRVYAKDEIKVVWLNPSDGKVAHIRCTMPAQVREIDRDEAEQLLGATIPIE